MVTRLWLLYYNILSGGIGIEFFLLVNVLQIIFTSTNSIQNEDSKS